VSDHAENMSDLAKYKIDNEIIFSQHGMDSSSKSSTSSSIRHTLSAATLLNFSLALIASEKQTITFSDSVLAEIKEKK